MLKNQSPQISVVIPVRNSEQTILKTLDSLSKQELLADEIILVSNTGDSTNTFVQEHCPNSNIKYINAIIPKSYIRDSHIKRWIGANNAKNSLIFFTDSKVLFQKDALKNAVTLMQKYKVEAVAASVHSWPEHSHTFLAKLQDKGLIKNNPSFPQAKILTKKNFGNTESLPVTTGLLITKHAFDLIKDDFGLKYSEIASTYDDYVTSWLLVNNGINILLSNLVITYHKHRLNWKGYLKQISRSGQSAAVMLDIYPDCPFGQRRRIQVISIISALCISIILFIIVLNLISFAYVLLSIIIIYLFLGTFNAIREKDLTCLLIPPVTTLLILHFTYHFTKWTFLLKFRSNINMHNYLQIS